MKVQQLKGWILLLSTFSIILFGCEDAIKEQVTFDKKFPKGNKNLENVLGASFQCEEDSGEVYTFNIKYDPKTQLNAITMTNSRGCIDSIANCWVSKFRGLYYLSEPASDTSYWVHAVKITDNEIKGLLDGYFQLAYLKDRIDNGEFKDMIIASDTAKKRIHLTYDKHRLKGFFSSVVDSCTTLKRIKPTNSKENVPLLVIPVQLDEPLIKKNRIALISKLYPNPTTDNITLQFFQPSTFTIDIYSLQRHLVKSIKTNELQATINLDELETGTYIILVTNLEGEKTTSKFILN